MRNPVFDVMKGIAMLLVIIGHSSIPYYPYRHIIFTFHMPLFFIISGYFFHKKKNIMLMKSDYNKLLKPYIFTSCIFVSWFIMRRVFGCNNEFPLLHYVFAQVYGSGSVHHSQYLGAVPWAGAIWFLLAMFWCRLFFNILFTGTIKSYSLIGGIAILATITDYYIVNLPFAILPGLSAMMFYMMGTLLKKQKKIYDTYKWYLLSLSSLFFVAAIFYSHCYMVICSYGIYPLDLVAGAFGTWCVYQLSLRICLYTSVLKKILEWIGFNSIVILCIHFMELHSGIWSCLGVPNDWYIKLPLQMFFIISLTVLFSYIPYFKDIYSIRTLKGNA